MATKVYKRNPSGTLEVVDFKETGDRTIEIVDVTREGQVLTVHVKGGVPDRPVNRTVVLGPSEWSRTVEI